MSRSLGTINNIETYYDNISVRSYICDECCTFWLTEQDESIDKPLTIFKQKRLCHYCYSTIRRSIARASFPRNPYNLKNWLHNAVKIRNFKCFATCDNDVTKQHLLSENPHGAVNLRKYIFRKNIYICDICFVKIARGSADKKILEDAANS